MPQVEDRYFQRQLNAFNEQKADWTKQSRADPDIGGKNWSQSLRLSAVALDAGGEASKEVRELFNESGLGNHPAMIRYFRNIGAQIERLRGKENSTVGQPKNFQDHLNQNNDKQMSKIYPDDPRRREDGSSIAKPKGRQAVPRRSRIDTLYPNDKPRV